MKYLLLATFISLAISSAHEGKWVWHGKSARVARFGEQGHRIVEPHYHFEGGNRPEVEHFRPLIRPSHNIRFEVERPFINRPFINRRPILYGPGPDIEFETNFDPTRYDNCKCTFSFNCKSPGLLFGSCGDGKKYCCEKFTNSFVSKEFGPNDREPEVLAGPGGPVDHLIRPDHLGQTGLVGGGYVERPNHFSENNFREGLNQRKY